MTFLGANISEALRLQPPRIFVMREARPAPPPPLSY